MSKLMLAATATVLAIATPALASYREVPPNTAVCSVVVSPDYTLNMRSGPGVRYPISDVLTNGDVVLETAYSGDWVQVTATLHLGEVSGWVHGKYTRNVSCPRNG
jgi:uncharacterized protein YraI